MAQLPTDRSTDFIPNDFIVGTLRESMKVALNFVEVNIQVRFAETDLRYQQRFDGQQKALVDAMMAAEKAVNAALAAADRAVVKAESAAERRFDSVNEFRATLADQSANLLPRSEAEARFHALSDKVDGLRSGSDVSGGKSQANATTVALGVALLAIAVAAWSHFTPPAPIYLASPTAFKQ